MEEVAVIADATEPSRFSLLLPPYHGITMVFQNRPLIVAFISLWAAQFLKPFTLWYKERRWDFRRIIGSGGMPSSHSSTVMGLACAVGFQEGSDSPLFAACLVLAAVVMYDASGVRLQAGRQAEVLNQIVYELPADHPLSDTRPLKEPIGHTPPQVAAGAVLGCFVAYVMYHFFPITTAVAAQASNVAAAVAATAAPAAAAAASSGPAASVAAAAAAAAAGAAAALAPAP